MTLRLTLFISGDSVRSASAIRSVERIRAAHDADAELEVVDCTRDPARAESSRILTTPTLVLETAGTQRRVTGDLADLDRVRNALGLPTPGSESPRHSNGAQ